MLSNVFYRAEKRNRLGEAAMGVYVMALVTIIAALPENGPTVRAVGMGDRMMKACATLPNLLDVETGSTTTQFTRNANQHIAEVDGISKSAIDHNTKHITDILDTIFDEKTYEKRLRPSSGGPPDDVLIDIFIRSMGPIDETEMLYAFDCYFRQTWYDRRLKFEADNSTKELALNNLVLDKMWTPDTYFYNGRGSYIHTISVPNKLIRIYPNGKVYFSSRLTVVAGCPMDLYKYPVDSQECPLFIGSFGYLADELRYVWKNGNNKSIVLDGRIELAQFELGKITAFNYTKYRNRAMGVRSVLEARFQLKRNIGYYLLQIYVPCILIVVMSWVSFFINADAAARVMLGITTILTTTTIAMTGRDGLPKISYSTALDIFILTCFCFVFAALTEYAVVNYLLTRHNKLEEKWKSKELNSKHIELSDTRFGRTFVQTFDGESSLIHSHPKRSLLSCCQKSTYISEPPKANTSRLDKISRYAFPFLFLTFNAAYWTFYVYVL